MRFLTRAYIPNLNDHASLQYPFIDQQGNGEQSYIIQLVGAAEKAKILKDESRPRYSYHRCEQNGGKQWFNKRIEAQPPPRRS